MDEETQQDLIYLQKKNQLNFYFIVVDTIAILLLAILLLIK